MTNDAKETLQLQKFIDLFVGFYGEEHRQTIESKLNTVEFIYVDSLVEKKEGVDQAKYDEEIKKAIETTIKQLNIKGNVQDYIDEVSAGTDPYVSPFCVEENGQLVGKMLFVLPKGEKLDDHTILHELNHVLASSFENITSDGFDFISGLEKMHIDFRGSKFVQEETTEKGKRMTEWFNEVLNDYVASIIGKQMKENNIEIFGSNSMNAYSKAFMVMKDFLDVYVKDVALLELQDEQDDLVEMIGKDNIFELNDKINTFMSYSLFEMFDLTNSISKKLGESEVIKQSETLKRLDEIQTLPLTEKERAFIDSLANLHSLSSSLANEKQDISEKTT